MTSTALMEKPSASVSVTPDQLDLVKRTVASGATDAELKLYLYDCQRQGVHPLDRLLHFTKRGGKYTPVTSIDLMRIRAAETGEYAGSDDAQFYPKPTGADPEKFLPPSAATVTVWRLVQSQRCAFTATARWAEYYPGDQGGHMWKKMPHTMLAKCAEALALRKGFPRQLAGLYASEELDQADRSASSPHATATHSASHLPPVASVVVEFPPSVPNGADSGHSIINTTTGEERPAPPAGYHYVTNYNIRNGWHEFDVLGLAADGSAMHLSTQRQFGELAAQAEADGQPVKVTWKGKPKGRPGEGYCQTLEVYKAPKDDADQRRSIMDEEAF